MPNEPTLGKLCPCGAIQGYTKHMPDCHTHADVRARASEANDTLEARFERQLTDADRRFLAATKVAI